MVRLKDNGSGFTLMELMIAIAVFSVVIAGVALAYQAQLRAYYTQGEIIEIQQNLRAAMYLIEREIKIAGLDPTGKAGAGFTAAAGNTVTFSMDITGGQADGVDNDEDGVADEGSDGVDNNDNGLTDEADEAEWYNGSTADADEQITYALSNDGDGDGINDGGTCNLMRNGQLLASNIDALNFVYLDRNGSVLAAPVANTSDIRAVQVSIVARSAATASGFSFVYVDTQSYFNERPVADGGPQVILPAQNDSFRRISMTTEIKCRNMGLE